MALPTFKKRVNPHGWDLYKNNSYYHPSLNTQLFNTATGGNCVWYAYGRFFEVWASAPKSERDAHPWPGYFSANGCRMVQAAGNKGFKTGVIPKPGAIISWGYNGVMYSDAAMGHVAFVEAVNTDSNGNIISIEISHSGWSSGDLQNQVLVPGPGGGQLGTRSWRFSNGYKDNIFAGFAYNPITFEGSNGVLTGVESSEETGEQGIDFQQRISTLISSDNYSFISVEEEDTAPRTYSSVETLQQSLQNLISGVATTVTEVATSAFQNVLSDVFAQALNQTILRAPKIVKQKSMLSLAENVVEAPFIEINVGGYKIGSYRGSLDMYPNYVSSLQVSKQNGIINQYTINLVHQIRPGDDSNLLDELFSTVNYSKIQIQYGDANAGVYFRDDNAMITNIRMNRSYTGMNISYTLEATSEGQLVKTFVTNFPAVTDRPSNVLYNLIYGADTVSSVIQEAFPGMRNQTFVSSNNLIPTNDAVVDLDAQQNVNVLDYINYLVGNMSNNASGDEVIRNSTYYVMYVDNDPNNPDGAYIQIKEITADVQPSSITNKIYDITVGYPKDIVYSFTVDTTQSWELLYKNSNKVATEYIYTITNNGDVAKYYSPSISSSHKVLSELNKNWWTQMVKFPVTAQLTVKGLIKPVMLMDYINIDVVFYGQPHIASGVYAITGQTDFLSGTGYRTTLSLVRVSNNE